MQIYISFYRYASENGEQTVLESMKDYLINTIQRTFEVGLEQAECLYGELLQCTRNKKLVGLSPSPTWIKCVRELC